VIRGGRTTTAQTRALEELWPLFGVDFAPQQLDLDRLFGRSAPRAIEIGFGNGEHLAALAGRHPERDYLGIEVHPPGVGHLLLRIEAQQLHNVRVSRHDATEVLAQQIPPHCIDQILILFPDPWHKKRHHKRRLLQPAFAQCLAERLRTGGRLEIATDWQPYAEHMLQVLNACPLLENMSAGAGYAPRSTERAATRFEKRGERLGHDVWELMYRRR